MAVPAGTYAGKYWMFWTEVALHIGDFRISEKNKKKKEIDRYDTDGSMGYNNIYSINFTGFCIFLKFSYIFLNP